MVAQCWANIVDVGTTLSQHWLIYGICRDVILDELNTVTVYCRSGHFRVRLDFREFVILGLYTKSRIHELSIKMIGSAIIFIISRDSSIRELVLLAKFAKIKTLRILPDLQYIRSLSYTRSQSLSR